MITSKQIISLSEEWTKTPVVRGVSVPIYENPNSNDLKEMFKSMKGSFTVGKIHC